MMNVNKWPIELYGNGIGNGGGGAIKSVNRDAFVLQ